MSAQSDAYQAALSEAIAAQAAANGGVSQFSTQKPVIRGVLEGAGNLGNPSMQRSASIGALGVGPTGDRLAQWEADYAIGKRLVDAAKASGMTSDDIARAVRILAGVL